MTIPDSEKILAPTQETIDYAKELVARVIAQIAIMPDKTELLMQSAIINGDDPAILAKLIRDHEQALRTAEAQLNVTQQLVDMLEADEASA